MPLRISSCHILWPIFPNTNFFAKQKMKLEGLLHDTFCSTIIRSKPTRPQRVWCNCVNSLNLFFLPKFGVAKLAFCVSAWYILPYFLGEAKLYLGREVMSKMNACAQKSFITQFCNSIIIAYSLTISDAIGWQLIYDHFWIFESIWLHHSKDPLRWNTLREGISIF